MRKKRSKRGKASTKPVRKIAAKRAIPKKAKAKAQRAGMKAKKSVINKKAAGPRCGCCYRVRNGSDSDLYFRRRQAQTWHRVSICCNSCCRPINGRRFSFLLAMNRLSISRFSVTR